MPSRRSLYHVKYDPDNIEEALEQWAFYKFDEPARQSIVSQLVNQSQHQTQFVFIKHRPIYKTKWLFIRHWFISINDKEWHPGNPELNIFTESEGANDDQNSVTVEIMEFCNHCVYWYFKTKFDADRAFNIICSNCELQLGYFWENFAIWATIISLILFILLKSFIFILIMLSVLFFLSFLIQKHEQIYMRRCPHVIPF